MDEYVNIPILENFDQTRQIGTARILKSKLPGQPDYVFSLGYTCDFDSSNMEVMCVSLMTDEQYLAYLNRKDSK